MNFPSARFGVGAILTVVLYGVHRPPHDGDCAGDTLKPCSPEREFGFTVCRRWQARTMPLHYAASARLQRTASQSGDGYAIGAGGP